MKKKRCTRCKKNRLLKSFYKSTHGWCKFCFREDGRERARKRRKLNPLKEKLLEKDRQLKWKYGINLIQYNKLLKRQGNKCAVCGKLQSKLKRMLAIDHNHKTGFIRGLLCTYCNSRLLQHFRDDRNRAVGLIKYLQKALEDDKAWD